MQHFHANIFLFAHVSLKSVSVLYPQEQSGLPRPQMSKTAAHQETARKGESRKMGGGSRSPAADEPVGVEDEGPLRSQCEERMPEGGRKTLPCGFALGFLWPQTSTNVPIG